MNKRVCYVYMSYPKQSEVFGRVEMQLLRKQGISVDVAAYRKCEKKYNCGEKVFSPSVVGSFISLLYILLFDLKMTKFAWGVSESVIEFFKIIALAPLAREIAKNNIKVNYDAIYFFWGHYPSLVIYFLNRMKYSGRTIVFSGAYDLVGNTGIMKWGVRNANEVVTHAQVNVNKIRSFYAGKINVLYRGVDCSHLIRENSTKRIDCVFAGRLIAEKKADVAVAFFNLYRKKYPEAKLHIFGAGPESNKIELLAEELKVRSEVILHGHVAQCEMFKVMAKARYFLFPSQHESERLPNVVKEAMLRGCVPLVSPSPGIEELVDHLVDGVIDGFENNMELYDLVFGNEGVDNMHGLMSEKAIEKVLNKFDGALISKARAELLLGRSLT